MSSPFFQHVFYPPNNQQIGVIGKYHSTSEHYHFKAVFNLRWMKFTVETTGGSSILEVFVEKSPDSHESGSLILSKLNIDSLPRR